MEKDSSEVIRRAVKGMLPKNDIRELLLDRNLIVHDGMYHNHLAQKLPQFVDLAPPDINKIMGLDNMTPENTKIIFESNPESPPEEFKDFPRDID